MTKAPLLVTCHMCNTDHEIKVDPFDYERWQQGELIQNVMPYLTAGERELLISQTCDPCFKKLFEGGDDDA